MTMLKDRIAKLTEALTEALDQKESLAAELAEVKGQLSTLVDWVMGDADALTTLQGVYLNPHEPAANRIKAAAAAIGFERPKLTATANLVVVDFRERVRQAWLKATAKLLEHIPDTPESA
jgi:hypothetical protein